MKFPTGLANHWRQNRPKTFAGSYLVWLMVGSIIVLWGLNLRSLITDYQERADKLITEMQSQLLNDKQEQLEQLFRAIYEHSRTLSLLPSLRSVEGGNRTSELEDVVQQGRLPLDTHQTVEQIYKNLASSISLSEIYYIIDGFDPDQGEVPFFMYDDEIVGINHDPFDSLHTDVPEEYELDEYHHYVKQLQWFKERYPTGAFSNISQVPALSSPLIRTCDNSQYGSLSEDNVLDTYGLLYSVPVFDFTTQRFKGMISAVLRANVLEATLLGVPFVPVTPEDKDLASLEGWQLPATPVGFILSQPHNSVHISDRRHPDLQRLNNTQLQQQGGSFASLPLAIASESSWTLHHYLTAEQVAEFTAPLRQHLYWGITARIGLLLLLLAIFIKANRDQQRHHLELIRLAHYDNVTSLPNRTLLYRHLQQSIARSQRHNNRLGLMFIDIDDFGSINDTLGHQVGDEVLMAIADRLRSSIRIYDELAIVGGADNELPTVARLGGDDFAIIFEDINLAEDGVLLGERLLQRFNDPLNLAGERVEISLSGGMAVFPDDAQEIDGLMAAADYALRHAASNGSGQFQMFNDEMRQKAARQTRLMRDLPDAIRHQLFTLNYQPKLGLKENQILSFEALIRWRHEELGYVSPIEFIPLLEQSGLIVDVGRWVLETACKQLRAWQLAGATNLCMSVNVSPRQLMLSDIGATVDEVLAETGVPPHTLILEITESMLIDNLDEGIRTLERIKSRGVKLAIDDFGTGYSSLTYLQGLPVDYLKLDKTMIDVIDDHKGAHVNRATIQLAHGLGLKAIAEGVESEEQADQLRGMKCDMIQGYWFSRPLPADQAALLLDAQQTQPKRA